MKCFESNITIDSIKAINKSDYKLYDMTILVENNEILKVEVKGEKPSSGEITFQEGIIKDICFLV